MNTLRNVLVGLVCLGGLGCATTGGVGSHGGVGTRSGGGNAFEVQGSTSRGSTALREASDSEPHGPVIVDRGIPTPQPAREPIFATPVPQPPIPGPIHDGRAYARYPKLSQ